jgi:hypothetical protein
MVSGDHGRLWSNLVRLLDYRKYKDFRIQGQTRFNILQAKVGKQMIKKLIKKMLNWANYIDGADPGPEPAIGAKYGNPAKVSPYHDHVGDELGQPINLKIYSADGGKIIQTVQYDTQRDRVHKKLYIVRDNEELGEEIAQILTREALSR